jgi:hypothetical protein
MAPKIGRIVPKLGGKKAAQKATPVKVTNKVSMKEDEDWKARDDAQTVARAHAIKADPERRARAAKEAKKLADEKAAELRGLRSISRGAN